MAPRYGCSAAGSAAPRRVSGCTGAIVGHRRAPTPRETGGRDGSPDPTAPGDLLPDVWFTRDLPVLRAIARLVDECEHGNSPYLLGAVVPASGLPKADVIAAAKALVSAGYADALTNHAGDIVRITGISAEARRLAGLWPTPQGSGTGCSSS